MTTASVSPCFCSSIEHVVKVRVLLV